MSLFLFLTPLPQLIALFSLFIGLPLAFFYFKDVQTYAQKFYSGCLSLFRVDSFKEDRNDQSEIQVQTANAKTNSDNSAPSNPTPNAQERIETSIQTIIEQIEKLRAQFKNETQASIKDLNVLKKEYQMYKDQTTTTDKKELDAIFKILSAGPQKDLAILKTAYEENIDKLQTDLANLLTWLEQRQQTENKNNLRL